MAKKDTKNKNQKNTKRNQDAKKGFFARIRGFFAGLRTELKLVTWPDKKKIKKHSVATYLIIFIFVAVIFLTDTIVTTALDATGFYDEQKAIEAQQERKEAVAGEPEVTVSEVEEVTEDAVTEATDADASEQEETAEETTK